MHRVLFGLFALLLSVAPVACRPAPQPQASVVGAPLWQLSDADSTIWLLGTVHALQPGVNWRSVTIDRAFESADVVVFEIDPTQANTEATMAAFAALGRNPPGVTLSRQLSPQEAELLGEVAARLGLSLNALEPLRPWLAAQQVSLAAALTQGARPELGVEQVLAPEARARGQAIESLETPLGQIEVLANLPPEIETAFFVSGLQQIQAETDTMGPINAAWSRGDVASMESLVMPMLEEAGPVVRDALIDQRNRTWVTQIEAYLAQDRDVFIAVGAAHLIGPKGVVNLLRENGHHVAQQE
jgi:uncharacterized protein